MICIECCETVDSLYTVYSATNIRLTVCSKCKRFADKYIEYENVLIFIDLLLLRPQAYRHMLYNQLDIVKSLRFWILITLFDVYLTWAQADPEYFGDFIFKLPVLAQYGTFLSYCILDSLVLHITVWTFCHIYVSPQALSTALIISSASKLFPILMVVWQYDVPLAAKILGWAVNFNTIEALKIVLNSSYIFVVAVTTIAALVRVSICKYFWLACCQFLWHTVGFC